MLQFTQCRNKISKCGREFMTHRSASIFDALKNRSVYSRRYYLFVSKEIQKLLPRWSSRLLPRSSSNLYTNNVSFSNSNTLYFRRIFIVPTISISPFQYYFIKSTRSLQSRSARFFNTVSIQSRNQSAVYIFPRNLIIISAKWTDVYYKKKKKRERKETMFAASTRTQEGIER